jgi:hypothetical protein
LNRAVSHLSDQRFRVLAHRRGKNGRRTENDQCRCGLITCPCSHRASALVGGLRRLRTLPLRSWRQRRSAPVACVIPRCMRNGGGQGGCHNGQRVSSSSLALLVGCALHAGHWGSSKQGGKAESPGEGPCKKRSNGGGAGPHTHEHSPVAHTHIELLFNQSLRSRTVFFPPSLFCWRWG